jgi:C4-dicarboxylate-specific signal transduction histidine kinase
VMSAKGAMAPPGQEQLDVNAGTAVPRTNLHIWERYPLAVAGGIVVLLLQAMTIAALVVSRSRRHESEARTAAILRAVPDLMFLQTRDGVYVDYHASNPAALLVPPESFMGRPMRDVLPAELAKMFEASFEKVGTGQVPVVMEYPLEIQSELRLYEARIVPCQESRVLSIVRDVTDRQRAETALRASQEKLVRVSRVAALGEFAASVAHEVSQPLTAIVANAKACQTALGAPRLDVEDIKTALGEIVDAGERASDIIRRNRELFRHKRIERAPTQMNDVIRRAVAYARERLDVANVAVEMRLASNLPLVGGDPIALEQVLLNLMTNAVDAMQTTEPKGRRVLITSRDIDGSHVEVAVRDAGVGLADVDLEQLFAPSYTTKVDGTGFGLSISRSVVEAHGGRIAAAQNDETGATFSFTIPIDSPAETA